MRKLGAYNFITLNGFFKGPAGDISWHQHGEEEGEYAAQSAGAENVLVFGRVTYEMMAAWWPTPMAAQMNAPLAESMNRSEKIVFSNTLTQAEWNNTKVIGGDIGKAMRKLKQEPGHDMTILGSGSIISHFTDLGLIDTYQVMIDPVALGMGTPMFNNIKKPLALRLVNHRVFKSGVILLSYERA